MSTTVAVPEPRTASTAPDAPDAPGASGVPGASGGASRNRAADRLVETLSAFGVRWVFGIPGAKVDPVYDALVDAGPELVLTRHEQNGRTQFSTSRDPATAKTDLVFHESYWCSPIRFS